MPTICMFRGIKVYINWNDHMTPHFHAKYGGDEVLVSIRDVEVLEGYSLASSSKCCSVGQCSIRMN